MKRSLKNTFQRCTCIYLTYKAEDDRSIRTFFNEVKKVGTSLLLRDSEKLKGGNNFSKRGRLVFVKNREHREKKRTEVKRKLVSNC